jgi:hypothetical protein
LPSRKTIFAADLVEYYEKTEGGEISEFQYYTYDRLLVVAAVG